MTHRETNEGAEPNSAQGFSFWIGVGLMAASFGIYLGYPLIPFLPISTTAKVAVALAGSVVSWSIFFVGGLLAGRVGRLYLKQLVKRDKLSKTGRI